MKKPELLSPIQDLVSLRAAMDAGADAVYFGVRGFNMRASAKNFTISDIPRITKLAHQYKVNTYLALNTIVYEKELNAVNKILLQAKKYGVDAVICFDPAVIGLAKKIGLPIHLSTQASVSNSESAAFYAKMGVSRIVLARECPLSEIKKIKEALRKKRLKTELEVFIHGAMCVSVSGRCFMSEHLYGSSANRGACAQPCRRKYLIKQTDGDKELEIGEDYVLSPKDLCTLPFLEKILTAPVACLKIEGRNRSPEYVATVTSAYRQAIDYYFSQHGKRGWLKEWQEKKSAWLKELKKVYHRGFGEGFFMGRPIGQWAHNYGSVASERKIHLGEVIKYYPKIKVAEIKIQANKMLRLKDEIIIQGEKTGLVRQVVSSMQKEHQEIKKAVQGEVVGVLLGRPVKARDVVYKIHPVK